MSHSDNAAVVGGGARWRRQEFSGRAGAVNNSGATVDACVRASSADVGEV
jgi:hypothetical protein